MISESIIKKEFVRNIIERDSKEIRSFQKKVIEENLNPRTGNLFSDIRRTSATKIIQSEGMALFSVSFLKYLRFLDIKSNRAKKGKAYIDIANRYEHRNKAMPLRRNLSLYNRVVFAVLYQKTQPSLKYGFTEEIKKNITEQLEKAGFKK